MGFRRVAVGAVAALALAGGGVAVAKEVRQSISARQACEAVRDRVAAGGSMVAASDGVPSVVILGDSYTAGDVLEDRRDGWAYVAGKEHGWKTTVAGIGGTGFTAGGYCGEHDYASRVGAAVATSPDVLIVQGGLNDADATGPEIRAAAIALLGEAASVERVVVVGPARAPGIPELGHVEEALKGAAEHHGREYISALGWDLPFLPDDLHLTVEGHAKFAGQVAAHLD